MADTDALAEAVARFALGEVVEPPAAVAQAWSNEVHRVRTDTGTFAVKLFPCDLPEARRAVLESAVSTERFVHRQRLVPVPSPVATGAGDWLVQVRSSTGAPRTARCHRWVDGIAATRDPLPVATIGTAGRHLGSLHALHLDAGDSRRLPRFDRARWDDAVRAALAAELTWSPALARLTPTVDRLVDDVEEVRRQRRPMRTSHRDYDPKNAVISTDGRLVITDWDNAGPVLAGVELVVAAASFASTDEELAAFLAGYRRAGGDADPADPPALSVEVADVDWLLRKVECCLPPADHAVDDQQSAGALIACFEDGIATLTGTAERIRTLLG